MLGESESELTGDMVARAVPRVVDHRAEPRFAPVGRGAMLNFRGRNEMVWLSNISSEGAMITWAGRPRIGEGVGLELEGVRVPAFIRWVRDGRVGLNFTRALPSALLAKYGGNDG